MGLKNEISIHNTVYNKKNIKESVMQYDFPANTNYITELNFPSDANAYIDNIYI